MNKNERRNADCPLTLAYLEMRLVQDDVDGVMLINGGQPLRIIPDGSGFLYLLGEERRAITRKEAVDLVESMED